MIEFQVNNFASADADSWNGLVKNSRSGLFLFQRGFMEYHADRFCDASLMLYSRNKLRGIFPANRSGSTVYSHQGLTYGGLLTGPDVKAAEIEGMFYAMADYYRTLGVTQIHYKKMPWCFSATPCAEDEYFLHQRGARLVRRDLSSVIDLRNRPKLSDSRRNVLKKARELGMQINELQGCAAFHALLTQALAKHSAKPVHSLAELELLIARFPAQIRLYGACLHGELLAAACLFDFGHIVHTQYLAASDAGRKVGALDHLLETLIQNSMHVSKHFFSFGISTEDAGKVLNHGLLTQKEGFGGRGVVHDFYEWDLQ